MKTLITLLAASFIAGTTGLHAAPAKTKTYPKDVCIVSDNKLGSMGRVITKTHGDQEVKFCCKPCVKKFDKDPKKYLDNLNKKK
ncbi:hypothetical protein JIN84_08130 [Luteolibacter yonseiensis]|uniref:YHS domain-containing protein n=1 Tax=Luteolibacter yonseiensis TaxID=1144680 RepID=A0A934R2D5_9BACT|nr:hypothetical protein [Luteolibacter yonseiensis]MBK1815579.1 hypothetical protein [Luteolibacter yonseiensis]